MPKKIPIGEKGKWLEEIENGKSDAAIASKYKHDIRTIRDGIEEVRQVRDVRLARIDLLKEVIRKHQDRLQDELRSILKDFEHAYDLAPLSWYRGDNSVFGENQSAEESKYSRFTKRGRPSVKDGVTMLDLLRQHLKGDKTKLWTLLAQWGKAYNTYLVDRGLLQRKVITVLENKTGYKVVDAKDPIIPPLIYSHVAGDLLYKSALDSVEDFGRTPLNENDIVAETERGVVTYHNSILTEAPGNEEQTRQNLIAACRDIKISVELKRVLRSTIALQQVEEKVKPIIESILLLDFIPGRCSVCQRLGL